MPQSTTPKKAPVPPRPSASILLISPTNEVLLLHRVQTSSSFPSAHVFPGGNCEAFHDGDVPAPEDPARHIDGPVYRWAGIRECFEESGLLLAKRKGEDALASIEKEERERVRKDVHNGKRKFGDVLKEWGVAPDLDSLIPFTRWVTPTNIPKRFTTQMYLYFMPLASTAASSAASTGLPVDSEAVIPIPTSDGGIEHQAARFLPASRWIELARAGDIILFPPQFFLLHHVARHLSSSSSTETLQKQRDELMAFVQDGAWGDKCISPSMSAKRKSDGRIMLGLDKPGPELEGSEREGIKDYVVLVDFRKEGPRNVEVGLRNEVLAEERAKSGKL